MNSQIIPLLWKSIYETFYMVLSSSFFAVLLGLPIGVALTVTRENSLFPMPIFNKILGFTVNLFRSIPFVIIMVMFYPLSKIIVGTTIGPTGVIVPLSILATPFIARLVANALDEVDNGLIEACKVMGARRLSIITHVMLPESTPALVNALTVSVINILSASAMAGVLGGGGIGDLAIRYGYQRYRTDVLIVAVIATVIIVQAMQITGDVSAYLIKKKRGLAKKY